MSRKAVQICASVARKATGQPGLQKPDLVIADRGYDHDRYRRLVWARGLISHGVGGC